MFHALASRWMDGKENKVDVEGLSAWKLACVPIDILAEGLPWEWLLHKARAAEGTMYL